MDTTIRNLDERLYREMKGRAALTGQTLGQVLNEAMAVYLAQPQGDDAGVSLASLGPLPFPEGSTHGSEQVDAVVYGASDAANSAGDGPVSPGGGPGSAGDRASSARE